MAARHELAANLRDARKKERAPQDEVEIFGGGSNAEFPFA
jgi:hypothetical protein